MFTKPRNNRGFVIYADKKGSLGLFALDAIFNSHKLQPVKTSDELIIELKNEKSETRYLKWCR